MYFYICASPPSVPTYLPTYLHVLKTTYMRKVHLGGYYYYKVVICYDEGFIRLATGLVVLVGDSRSKGCVLESQ